MNLLKIVNVELFKKKFIILILFSGLFCSTTNQNKVNSLLSFDYSSLSSHEFQVGFGVQNNSIYTSIDKMISHNLLALFKLSKLESSDFNLFSQSSLLLNSNKRKLNFIIAINYLISDFKVNRWTHMGLVFDLFDYKKITPSLGLYYNFFSISNLSNNRLNYFFNIKSKINNTYSFIIGSNFNLSDEIFNYNIEINLEI